LKVYSFPVFLQLLRHRTIFKKFNTLNDGEFFVIINDYDPKPFYYQLFAERDNIFSRGYLEQGPAILKVHINKNEKTFCKQPGHHHDMLLLRTFLLSTTISFQQRYLSSSNTNTVAGDLSCKQKRTV
jgi:uncharacterized protein (DUF2249 family)